MGILNDLNSSSPTWGAVLNSNSEVGLRNQEHALFSFRPYNDRPCIKFDQHGFSAMPGRHLPQ